MKQEHQGHSNEILQNQRKIRRNEEYRQARVREAYATRKDEIIAKIITPESNRLRKETQARRYKEDPSFRQRLHEAQQAGKKTISDRDIANCEAALGGPIESSLRHLITYEQLLASDIQALTGLSKFTIKRHAKRYQIPLHRKTDIDSVRKFQKVQALLWEDPERITMLSESEKEVVSVRFLTDGRVPTMHEASRKLGLSRQRIGQIEDSALAELSSGTT